jgi:hypothetical protein
VLPRQVSVRASGEVRDADGKINHFARLVATSEATREQEIPPRGKALWAFEFAVDDGSPFSRCTSVLEISAPGMTPQLLTAEYSVRQPLLWSWVWYGSLTLIICYSLASLKSTWSWWHSRSRRSGVRFMLRPGKSWADRLKLELTPRGQPFLVALQPLRWGQADADMREALAAHRRLPVNPQSFDHERPVLVEEAGFTDTIGWSVALREFVPEPPSVVCEIQTAPEEDKQAARLARKMTRRYIQTFLLLLTLGFLLLPSGLRWAQWFYDFFTL